MLLYLLLALQAADDPTIVVSGQQRADAEIRQEASSFVKAVAADAGSSDQLGRWNQPVCASVFGATAEEEALVLARIREVATEARIRLAKGKKCTPNLVVAYTSDPSGVTGEVLKRNPHAARTLPVAMRDDLVTGAYPVRWWYDFKVESRDGVAAVGDHPALLGALHTSSNGPGAGAGGQIAQSDNQSGNVSDYSSSLIGTKSRQSVGGATIVVDVQRVRGQSKEAVASYVAMVGLAPLKLPPRPLSTPTITNLFHASPGQRADDLSDWDRAFIAALYRTPANRLARVQRASMTEHIARKLRGEE